tara:strand:+ start:184 stop:444 length:261 start_codon:yes stop_codon:yes gene_type:complete
MVTKKQINDLLLKMQAGEKCIGETANELFNLVSVNQQREQLLCSDSHCCKVGSEQLHTKVFNLANELAKAGYGNQAVRMHHICNGM